LISAIILQDRHAHDDSRENRHHHHDHNLRAAYLHVLADALTSLSAIVALLSGKYFGWEWLDPAMGIAGAAVITYWSYGLLRNTSSILLDRGIEKERKAKIKERIEVAADNRVADIHIWKVGPANYAAIISLVTHYRKPPDYYKRLLDEFRELSHVTVEVNQCDQPPCLEL
jgi:cation diffusion facilitator family transporter